MNGECKDYFTSKLLPTCLSPRIGANYTAGNGIMVVTRYAFLPDGTEEVDADKFYTGNYPLTEKIRSVMDNSASIISQGVTELNGQFREDIALYHFILRPVQNKIDTKREVQDIDLDFAANAFINMVQICEPKLICFCGHSLLNMVEDAISKYHPLGSLAEFAKRVNFSYTIIYEPTLPGLDNGISSRGWFVNLLQKNSDVHGKSKYKLISQAFDRAMESNDLTGLFNVINEFQKEVNYKADSEESAAPEKIPSEDRIKQNIEARRKRSEKLQNTAKKYWGQYIKLSQELFKDTPVKVWPYIGNEYFSSDVKILSLGESHYKKARADGSKPDLTPDSTIDVFLGSYQWNGWQFRNGSFAESIKYTVIPAYCRCYRKIATMISECKSGESDFVYDRIAFMNYFQCVVGAEPKDFKDGSWVKKEDLDEADKAVFEGALPRLLPDVVIVWGYRLFGYIQKSGRSLTAVKDSENCLWEYSLELSDGTKKKILFFVIQHPSSFGWKNDEAQRLWSHVKSHFPQIDCIRKHHPALPLAYDIYTKMRSKYKGLFLHFYSECSYSMALFPIENGKANEKSPRCMYAEFIFDESMKMSIRFYTKDFSEETCRKILEHPIWGLPEQALESSMDGKFTLATFPVETPTETLEAEIQNLAEKMLNYRKETAW